MLRRSFLAAFGVSAGAAIVGLVLAPVVISVLYGAEYSESSQVLRVLLFASIAVYLGVWSSQIIVNEKLYGTSALRTFAGLACTLVCVPVFTNWLGVTGTAIAVLLSASIAAGFLLASSEARRVFSNLLKSSE